ncbi:MAG: hypothetical protein ACK5Q4_13880 [Phycisphaerae bacterium]
MDQRDEMVDQRGDTVDHRVEMVDQTGEMVDQRCTVVDHFFVMWQQRRGVVVACGCQVECVGGLVRAITRGLRDL